MAIANSYFGKKAQALDRQVMRGMIEPNVQGQPLGKQCKLISISRSYFCYVPKGETEMYLELMRLIDEQFLEAQFYGVRQITWHLRSGDHLVNEKRIRQLMRLMGLMPIYQKPNTSKAAKRHKIHRYLLRGLPWLGPTKFGALTSPICRCAGGFLYLFAIIDWRTRRALSWHVSSTPEAAF